MTMVRLVLRVRYEVSCWLLSLLEGDEGNARRGARERPSFWGAIDAAESEPYAT